MREQDRAGALDFVAAPVGGRHLEGAVCEQRHPEDRDGAHNGVRQPLPAL